MTAPAYTRPDTLDEALEILHRAGVKATVLAGGQDLVPLMNQGRLSPSHLVDISRLPGLSSITEVGIGTIAIGPLVAHAGLQQHPLIRARIPLLADAADQIGGGVQVRNRGTIGGSVCAANPVYDLPVCLVAADAQLILQNKDGQRRVPASSFLLGAGATALAPGELLVGVECPSPPADTGSAYEKLKFTDGGYTIAGAACVITLDSGGTCVAARVAVGGVMEAPIRLREVEQALTGRPGPITDEAIERAASLASSSVAGPISDVMADGAYRRAMAAVVVRRALGKAARRARAGHAAPDAPAGKSGDDRR